MTDAREDAMQVTYWGGPLDGQVREGEVFDK